MNTIARREALKRTAMLMGGAVSASALAGILKGCSPSQTVNWVPKFLSKDQATLTGELANCIIPPTETPGALDVGVDTFIDLILAEAYPETDQKVFLDGLAAIETESDALAGKSFIKLSAEQKHEILQNLENEAFEIQTMGRGGKHFFYMLKELTLLGYFTSEEGMKQNFDYNPVPGNYETCTPLNPEDKLQAGNHI